MKSRIAGMLIALTAHATLGVTIWFLFPFLMGGQAPPDQPSHFAWWIWDAFLIAQFGVLHSLLLWPPMRKRLERIVPEALYGCFFTLMTCLCLLLVVLTWQTCPGVLWQFEGWSARVINVGYILSWVGLFYSIGLIGYGFQTGWTPFWAWVRGRPRPRRRFEVRGAYRLLRHPVYLSFLGLVWFTPLMTWDRAILTGLMTVYILIGSALKDQRLVYYLGDEYRRYQAQVPGYPVFGFGPLGRVMPSEAEPQPVPIEK